MVHRKFSFVSAEDIEAAKNVIIQKIPRSVLNGQLVDSCRGSLQLTSTALRVTINILRIFC